MTVRTVSILVALMLAGGLFAWLTVGAGRPLGAAPPVHWPAPSTSRAVPAIARPGEAAAPAPTPRVAGGQPDFLAHLNHDTASFASDQMALIQELEEVVAASIRRLIDGYSTTEEAA